VGAPGAASSLKRKPSRAAGSATAHKTEEGMRTEEEEGEEEEAEAEGEEGEEGSHEVLVEAPGGRGPEGKGDGALMMPRRRQKLSRGHAGKGPQPLPALPLHGASALPSLLAGAQHVLIFRNWRLNLGSPFVPNACPLLTAVLLVSVGAGAPRGKAREAIRRCADHGFGRSSSSRSGPRLHDTALACLDRLQRTSVLLCHLYRISATAGLAAASLCRLIVRCQILCSWECPLGFKQQQAPSIPALLFVSKPYPVPSFVAIGFLYKELEESCALIAVDMVIWHLSQCKALSTGSALCFHPVSTSAPLVAAEAGGVPFLNVEIT